MKGVGEKGRREEWKIGKMEEWKKKSKAMMKLLYYIRRFWEIPGVDRKMLIYGLFFSFVGFLMIRMLPFKYSLKLIKFLPNSILMKNNKFYIRQTKKTLKRIISIAPWVKNCFVKALTVNHLLYEFGIKSHIILALRMNNNHVLDAHAYIIDENHHIYFKNDNFIDIYTVNISLLFSN
jgi:hypothetical protein